MPVLDFGILVALMEEAKAALSVFRDFKEITDGADTWYRASIKCDQDRSYEVVASFMTDMGPRDAQDLTSKMIRRWDPAYIVLVGIAGSFNKDVRLGDIVVSQQVFGYDLGKAVGERIEYRPQGYPCSMTLIRQQEALTLDGSAFRAWQKASRRSAGEKIRKLKSVRKKVKTAKKQNVRANYAGLKAHHPTVHFGTVASGSLVVASKSKQRKLLALHGKILATEMEGAGVLHATFRESEIPTPAIVIKGMSDAADKNKAAADQLRCWRELAAEDSARLALAMIQRGRIRPLMTDQIELDVYRGDIADARKRIKEVSVGMSLLAFPRLVKSLGPLTQIRLDLTALGAGEEPLKIIEIVVEYKNRDGRPRTERVSRSSSIAIDEQITAGQIGVYLLIDGTPERIKFQAKSWAYEREAVWS